MNAGCARLPLPQRTDGLQENTMNRQNTKTDSVMNWIGEGSPWLQFAVKTQLLGQASDSSSALRDTNIRAIVSRLKDPAVGLPALQTGIVKYTSTGNAFWDLFFLADIGFSSDDLAIQDEIRDLFALQNADGTLVVQRDTRPGYLCIPAILLAPLAKLGYRNDPHILRFIEIIWRTRRLDGGWHCAAGRAVGKKLEHTVSCPMDTLNLLMLLGQYEAYRTDPRLHSAIDVLLTHWKRRMEPFRPYGFGIGTDFLKLRYPAVKYGILRVLDVLSLYPYAVKSPEYNDMLSIVMHKAACGRYTPESVSRSYAAFDFGQTKIPSRWLTFLIRRLQKRTEDLR
jgi:hypothetical protein